MKKQTFWYTLGVLLVIPLVPSINLIVNRVFNSLFSNKIDDWVYEATLPDITLSSLWTGLELGEQVLVTLLIALIVTYFVFPLYKFAQGLIARKKDRDLEETSSEYETRYWRRHRLWLGAPAVYIVALLYIGGVIFVYDLIEPLFDLLENIETNIAEGYWIVNVIFLILLSIFPLLVACLFFGGLYSWIRNHGSDLTKRIGRNKFLFSFYYLFVFILLIGGLFILGARDIQHSASVDVAPRDIPAQYSTESANDSIGLAAGGASDIENFRENITNGYLPIPTDITHEGIFYDYTFDTGQQEECGDLFCPSYTTAISPDPFSDSPEHFLSVGLNSGIQKQDFERKKLNLVVVLDISGSMGSTFDRYYYDRYRTDQENVADEEKEPDNRSKMKIANESVTALLDHLEAEDRFGMVLFESDAYLAKGLRRVEKTNMKAIEDHIREIRSMGGTNMEAGYREGTELLQRFKKADKDEYENRIIFLTDAMPNTGQVSEESLLGLTEQNADDGIYTTFIGMGVDFNTELINEITQVRGANYYSVHSAEEFLSRMDDGFEHMVTPLVFDLTLDLESEGYDIREVYGSPEADLATGEIMKVNTLFPSERTEGETRGGLVLLHLDKLTDEAEMKLKVSYKDRSGESFENEQEVQFNHSEEGEYFDNSGIHKGVVLSRYVNTMKDWIMHEADRAPEPQIEIPVVRYNEEGIPTNQVITELGQWERTSDRLTLSEEYRPIMTTLKNYLTEEIEDVGDSTMQKELNTIDKIMSSGQK